jgi:hypothetical protein
VRRTKLIWFALGAATALGVTFAFDFFQKDGTEQVEPYLSVLERALTDEEADLESVAQTSGRLLRECGAKEFYMKPSDGADVAPYSLIKINQTNAPAIDCVLKRGSDEGFPIHIMMITDQHAQTH